MTDTNDAQNQAETPETTPEATPVAPEPAQEATPEPDFTEVGPPAATPVVVERFHREPLWGFIPAWLAALLAALLVLFFITSCGWLTWNIGKNVGKPTPTFYNGGSVIDSGNDCFSVVATPTCTPCCPKPPCSKPRTSAHRATSRSTSTRSQTRTSQIRTRTRVVVITITTPPTPTTETKTLTNPQGSQTSGSSGNNTYVPPVTSVSGGTSGYTSHNVESGAASGTIELGSQNP